MVNHLPWKIEEAIATDGLPDLRSRRNRFEEFWKRYPISVDGKGHKGRRKIIESQAVRDKKGLNRRGGKGKWGRSNSWGGSTEINTLCRIEKPSLLRQRDVETRVKETSVGTTRRKNKKTTGRTGLQKMTWVL